jgi:hypothetical protein
VFDTTGSFTLLPYASPPVPKFRSRASLNLNNL